MFRRKLGFPVFLPVSGFFLKYIFQNIISVENKFLSTTIFVTVGELVERDLNELFRVKVDLPSFQIEVVSKDPSTTIPEVRRILEAMRVDDQLIYEEFITQELQAVFSEIFTQNSKMMQSVKKILKQEEDYRVFTMELSTTATLDLDNQTRTINISKKDVKNNVQQLSAIVDGNTVKQGIVHVSGRLSKEDKLLIVDHIHKHMPTAQLRAFESPGETDKVLVECIFFGEFDEE